MNTTATKKPKHKPPRSSGALLAIDLAMLEELPDEGQMIGFKPIALQVRNIGELPGFEEVTADQITGRLKSLLRKELVVFQPVFPTHRGLGWQRTAKGREVLTKNGKAVV